LFKSQVELFERRQRIAWEQNQTAIVTTAITKLEQFSNLFQLNESSKTN